MNTSDVKSYTDWTTRVCYAIVILVMLPWGQMCFELTGHNASYHTKKNLKEELNRLLGDFLFSVAWVYYFITSFTPIEFDAIISNGNSRNLLLERRPKLLSVIMCNILILAGVVVHTVCKVYIALGFYRKEVAECLMLTSVWLLTAVCIAFMLGYGFRTSGLTNYYFAPLFLARSLELCILWSKLPESRVILASAKRKKE